MTEIPIGSVTTTPVILTAGQSNADGRVPINDLPAYISYKYCQWSYGSGDFCTATGDFQPFQPTVGRTDLGPRWGFDAVVYYLLEQRWQRPFYVIKQTMDGTAINTACSNSTHGWFWSAYTETLNGNKSLLRAFTRQIDDCIKNLPKDYDIKVLLWHQGESDMPHPELYYDNFREVIRYIRQHLVAVTGEKKYARLPVICGTYAKNSRNVPQKLWKLYTCWQTMTLTSMSSKPKTLRFWTTIFTSMRMELRLSDNGCSTN